MISTSKYTAIISVLAIALSCEDSWGTNCVRRGLAKYIAGPVALPCAAILGCVFGALPLVGYAGVAVYNLTPGKRVIPATLRRLGLIESLSERALRLENETTLGLFSWVEMERRHPELVKYRSNVYEMVGSNRAETIHDNLATEVAKHVKRYPRSTISAIPDIDLRGAKKFEPKSYSYHLMNYWIKVVAPKLIKDEIIDGYQLSKIQRKLFENWITLQSNKTRWNGEVSTLPSQISEKDVFKFFDRILVPRVHPDGLASPIPAE